MTLAHAERAHALLGASKADQWINCTPSARLQDGIAEKKSEYADEGTFMHEMAECILRKRITICNAAERRRLDGALQKMKTHQFYNTEIEHAVKDYVEFVEERFMAAKARSSDAIVLLEEHVDFSEWVPEGKGTCDVVLIADGVLEVIDLKGGKGVPVSAYNNPQVRLYGLGAWSGFNYLYSIDEIHMTIYQPRLDSTSTDIMPIGELLDWAETVVRPAAVLAYAGEGDFKAGDHCKWCKVKGNCRARTEANLEALQYEFKDPALLSFEEVGNILFIAEQLKKWATDVEGYAYDQAVRGEKFPLWKLVEGRSNRAITDKVAAKAALEAAKLESTKYLKPQEMFGIGDLEKQIGKKELGALLAGLIVKPQGKPVLVPETDNRPEMNSIDGDFANEEFSMED